MSDDRIHDFETRLVALAQSVEAAVGLMQAESEEARRALSLYGRTRRLLGSFLGRASRHQGRACHLGQRLAGYADVLKTLQRELDTWSGQDTERARAARLELRRIGEQVRHWQVESDGLQ
jgi:hypothetical protein